MKNRAISTISIISLIFTLIALGLSISAICIRYPRYNMEFDYLGLLIGLATLLVALTVGWQIYTIIDTKTAINEQNTKLHDAIEKQEKIISELELKHSKLDKKLEDKINTVATQIIIVWSGYMAMSNLKIALNICLISIIEYNLLNEDPDGKKAFDQAIVHLKNILTKLNQKGNEDIYTLHSKNFTEEKIADIRKKIFSIDDPFLTEWIIKVKLN